MSTEPPKRTRAPRNPSARRLELELKEIRELGEKLNGGENGGIRLTPHHRAEPPKVNAKYERLMAGAIEGMLARSPQSLSETAAIALMDARGIIEEQLGTIEPTYDFARKVARTAGDKPALYNKIVTFMKTAGMPMLFNTAYRERHKFIAPTPPVLQEQPLLTPTEELQNAGSIRTTPTSVDRMVQATTHAVASPDPKLADDALHRADATLERLKKAAKAKPGSWRKAVEAEAARLLPKRNNER